MCSLWNVFSKRCSLKEQQHLQEPEQHARGVGAHSGCYINSIIYIFYTQKHTQTHTTHTYTYRSRMRAV